MAMYTTSVRNQANYNNSALHPCINWLVSLVVKKLNVTQQKQTFIDNTNLL